MIEDTHIHSSDLIYPIFVTEGTNIVGVQMLRWVQARGMAWTGFLHAENKEVLFKIDRYIFDMINIYEVT